MRKTFVSVVALVGLGLVMTGTANAQDQGQRPQRGQGRGQGQGGRVQLGQAMATAFKSVSPTEDQQKKFDELNTKFRQDLMGLRQSAGDDRQALGQKMRDLNDKFRTDVNALLTAEQKPKFEEALRRAQNPTLADRLAELNLTDEQKEKIKPIAEAAQAEVAKLRQDQSLDQQARREKTTQIVTDFKAKVRPILTAEQQTKLDGLQIRLGGGGRGQGRRNP
jgi:hypothetical protein